MLGLRVVTAEATPRVLELRGRDVFPVVHAYGTNGIIVAVEVPLARAQPWVDVTACFPSLQEAAAFALDAGNAPSVPCRGAAVYQAPVGVQVPGQGAVDHARRPALDGWGPRGARAVRGRRRGPHPTINKITAAK